MKHIWVIVLSVICGFAGGIAATRIATRHDAVAPTSVQSFSVLRANRFELLNPAGQPIAYWGFDKGSNTNEIAFIGDSGKPTARFGTESSQIPFLVFAAQDGRVTDRLLMRLDRSGRPILAMSDEGWEGRVMLGYRNSSDTVPPSPELDNWSLTFSDPATHQA